LIPKEKLARFGEVVVEEELFRIIIRPKNMTEATRGFVGNGDVEATDRLIEAVEEEWIEALENGEPYARSRSGVWLARWAIHADELPGKFSLRLDSRVDSTRLTCKVWIKSATEDT
jgi:hypothetical protein